MFTKNDIRSLDDFNESLNKGKSQLIDHATRLCLLLNDIFNHYKGIKKSLKSAPIDWLDAMSDIKSQINELLFPDFLVMVEAEWLEQYPRYLTAISKRMEKIRSNPLKDRECRLKIADLWSDYIDRNNRIKSQHAHSPQLDHYRWMLEELRVSLFAQELKTRFPVSEKRLKKYWDDISDV